MKQKLFIFFLIFSFKAFSDFQGSFDSIENLPGFIDFNEDSRWYKGPIKLKYRKLNDGVDRRTPSKILDSFFDGDAFSVDKANKLIKTVETFRKNAFLSFCMEKLPKKALDNFFCILGLEKKLDKKLAKKFKKIQKKWKDEKYNLGLDEVVRRIESAIKKSSGITRENINTANSQAFLNDFFTGYEIFEILKGEDAPRGMQGGFNGMIIRHGGVFLFDTSIIGDCRRKSGICDRYSKRAEAANLLVPTDLKNQHPDQVFLSKDDLAKLKNNKYPLENLNPPDSGFWRKPKVAVSKFNLTNYNKSGYSSLANELNHGQRLKMMNRHIPIDVVYKPGRFKGGTTPKFYGYLKNTKTGKKGKQKWKVKFVTDKFGLTSNSLFNLILNLANSGETNTEPAVNNLAAALGFGVDPTYYKDRIRVFFPDEIYQDSKGKELSKSQWTELFDNELVRVRKEIRDAFSIDYNTDSSFNQKFVKIDPASGRPYIELKSVALEKKKDEERDINIGAFVRHGIGKSLKREHRAFALFLAWVEDRDTKNENDRAKLLNSAKGSKSPKFKLGHSASDMGSAFGTGSINNLPTDMVETLRYHKFGSDKGEVKRIKLTYRRIGMLEIINAMSNSDAKWILKMMAQFGLEQLKDCFNAAGFPSVVAEAFARKMITRRNQLLEAFKMDGMVFKDFAGNDFKIDLKKKKLSLITNPKEKDLIYADSLDKKYYYEDGFNRPIAGSEHLFRRPKAGIPKFVNPWILKDTALELYDPKKQMFPRYWDADMLGALLGDSEGQEKRVIKDLKKVAGDFIRNLLVNPVEFPLRAGFNLARLAPGVNTEVGQVCKTDCYFSGILKGVSTFFPKRMAFDNPDKESPKKTIIVDTFRIGINVGEGVNTIEKWLGLNLIGGLGVIPSAGFFVVYEFMKIKFSEKRRADYSKEADFSFPVLKDARRAFIDNMASGDSLILSSYVGVNLAVEGNLGVISGPLNFVGPYIRLSTDLVLTKRVSMMKKEDGNYLANWAKLSKKQISAILGLKLGISIPLASASVTKIKKSEMTYNFDLRKPEEKKILMKYARATYPIGIPDKYKLKKRVIKSRDTRFNIGFLFFANKNWYRRRQEASFYDFINNKSFKEFSYERESTSSWLDRFNLNSSGTKFRTSMNEKGEMYLKIKYHIDRQEAKRRHFVKYYTKMIDPVTPDDFFVFNINAVKEYLGGFEFQSQFIINHAGIVKFFKKTPFNEICQAFVEKNYPKSINKYTKECNSGRYKKTSLKYFMSFFKSARKALDEINIERIERSGRRDKHHIYKGLKKLTKLFKKYIGERNIIDIFKKIVPAETYSQKAFMYSRLAGFPNDTNLISISKNQGGKLKLTPRLLADSPEEQFALFSDYLHRLVSKQMFIFGGDANYYGIDLTDDI